jgi:hypothetical protein
MCSLHIRIYALVHARARAHIHTHTRTLLTQPPQTPAVISVLPIHTARKYNWVPGALSRGVKRPGREADHSPPSSTEVSNAWSYTSTLPIRLHGMVL